MTREESGLEDEWKWWRESDLVGECERASVEKAACIGESGWVSA